MTQRPVTAGLVTIVIPTYDDDPQHIHDSVGSALAQSYPMTEVVVDDGSTRSDSTDALAALEGVRLVSQPNMAHRPRGSGRARASSCSLSMATTGSSRTQFDCSWRPCLWPRCGRCLPARPSFRCG